MKRRRVRWPHKLPDVLTIPVGSEGLVALVDEADFWSLSEFTWYPLVSQGSVYANTLSSKGPISMHRVIMTPPARLWVDHVNRDGLDNRRANLRVCTPSQNAANRRKARHVGGAATSSRYKGVHVSAEGVIAVCRNERIGVYRTEEAAARAYDKAARAVFGEFARLNFPKRGEQSALLVEAA